MTGCSSDLSYPFLCAILFQVKEMHSSYTELGMCTHEGSKYYDAEVRTHTVIPTVKDPEASSSMCQHIRLENIECLQCLQINIHCG